MGTWGVGIFDDDVAGDVRWAFEDALAEGLSVGDATRRVREAHQEALDDPDDGLVVRLALAALQLKRGELQPAVGREALAVIDQGQGLDRWEEAGDETLAERRQVLDEFRERLRAALASREDRRLAFTEPSRTFAKGTLALGLDVPRAPVPNS